MTVTRRNLIRETEKILMLKPFKKKLVSLAMMGALLMSNFGYSESRAHSDERKEMEPIKAYCIDFNWGVGRKAGFARPGEYKGADPKAHVAWHKAVNANVIQTFAVSCNGYAWYKSKLIPEQPGLMHDFLTEVVKLGHAEGMKVMGYFCIGANSRWGKENPELSYGTPSSRHIPYTDEYLAFLSASITDAIKTTGMDGFMIDWVWMPNRKTTNGKWIDAEKKLYQQLMGESFPGEDKLSKEKDLAYGRKAIDRCWAAIRKAAKGADPDQIVWLTTNKVRSPLVVNSKMYREVDWFMGEAGKLEEIQSAKSMVGKHTRMLTCLSDFGGGNASRDVPEAIEAGVGLYGYAKPSFSLKNATIGLDGIFPKQLTELGGNGKRIAALARAYGGKSMDSIWKDGEFVEPENPLPFRLELRKRSVRHSQDYGRVDVGDKSSTVVVKSNIQKGRAMLTRVAKTWPETIAVRILRDKKKKPKPYPPEFRVANGKIGVSITQKEEVTVVAGKMEAEMSIKTFWKKEFLNSDQPKFPIEVETVKASVTDDAVEIVLPVEITKSNPSTICFEWGIDGDVF